MTEAEIYATLTEVFQDIFDDDAIKLTAETNAADVKGWDSQAHVSLIVATELRFAIRFRTAEYEKLRNVGEFVGLIGKKIASR